MPDVALSSIFADPFEYIEQCDIRPVDTVARDQISPYTGQAATDEIDMGGEWLTMSMRTVALDRREVSQLVANLLLASRAGSRLLLQAPAAIYPRGQYPASGILQVPSGAVAGLRTLIVSGLAAGALVAQGDMLVSAAGNPYLVLTDGVANGSGQATINLFPRLRVTIEPNGPLYVYRGTRTARWRVTKLPEISSTAGRNSSVSIEVSSS